MTASDDYSEADLRALDKKALQKKAVGPDISYEPDIEELPAEGEVDELLPDGGETSEEIDGKSINWDEHPGEAEDDDPYDLSKEDK